MLLLSRIWFLLYDASTSLPYKGVTADFVSLSAGSIVAEFRKAVKVEDANKLSSFDADDFIVYRNRLSFEKRNIAATVEEQMEDPLKSSRPLDGLGETEEEALVVVVPPLIKTFQNQPSPFTVCQNPFFNSICDLTEIDGSLSFGQNIPATSLNKLYIRECYRKIASGINPSIDKAILTGTPGTGKSLFVIYLLWKLVKEGKRVLISYHTFNIYYDGKGCVFKVAIDRLLSDIDESFWDDRLWCLFDAKGKTISDLNKFPYDNCKFIISTSPQRELINDFKKSRVLQNFYMPPWTEREMETIAPSFPNATDWRDRFEILGGVPGYVLERTTQNATEMIEEACADWSMDDCLRKIGPNSRIAEKLNVINSLVHILSEDPFTQSSVGFATRKALVTLPEDQKKGAKRMMRDLLAACDGNPFAASLYGFYFKSFAMELLEKGGTFSYRKLLRGPTEVKRNKTFLEIPPSTRTVVDKVERNQTPNMLHVPKSKNYPAIEAWIPGIGTFQMTVRMDHDIKSSARNDLDLLGEPKFFYWCLPTANYGSFTKKDPIDIDQYAILIPFPE